MLELDYDLNLNLDLHHMNMEISVKQEVQVSRHVSDRTTQESWNLSLKGSCTGCSFPGDADKQHIASDQSCRYNEQLVIVLYQGVKPYLICSR